jgi:hypothetical protein
MLRRTSTFFSGGFLQRKAIHSRILQNARTEKQKVREVVRRVQSRNYSSAHEAHGSKKNTNPFEEVEVPTPPKRDKFFAQLSGAILTFYLLYMARAHGKELLVRNFKNIIKP